ncbi:MAG: hypothetical protein H6742_22110 [Alphaproteobacteria bacterium]|nr:hypothetical protein [Alphaproteobacteria bacterium]
MQPLLTLLLCAACGAPTHDPPQAAAAAAAAELPRPQHLPGGEPSLQTGRDGQTVAVYGPIFLRDDLRDAPGMLQLRLEGVHAEPGSAAEIYLQDNSPELYDPADYLGSVAVVAGGATDIPQVVLEVHDFEADGQRFTARSTLRELRSFGVVVVPLDGSIQIDGFTLMAKADPPGTEWEVLQRGSHEGVEWTYERRRLPASAGESFEATHQLRFNDHAVPVWEEEGRGLLCREFFGFLPNAQVLAEQLIEYHPDFSPLATEPAEPGEGQP